MTDEKKYFRIFNDTDNEFFLKLFLNETEARHWVINHLDLSKQWNIQQENTHPSYKIDRLREWEKTLSGTEREKVKRSIVSIEKLLEK